jgi:leucyl/phenylalanyl-tRNA--protein transferase
MFSSQKESRKIIDPQFLILAYCHGYFPMADSKTGPIHWYSPDPRAIIPLDTFHTPASLNRIWKQKKFEIRFDTQFETVMQHCADREETWISEEIVKSYLELYRLGYGHSVETWYQEKLVGGLYGVAVGGAFFGESMFHLARDASKMALVALVKRLQEKGFSLLDTQFTTPHLLRFGTVEISADKYKKLLTSAIRLKVTF